MFQILYGVACVFFAWLNAKWISEGKRIRHAINGLIHLIVAGAFFYFFGWKACVTSLLIARVFFDFSLNLFRKLPLDYLPVKPKSIADKLEKLIFKDGLKAKVIYIFIIICLQFLR